MSILGTALTGLVPVMRLGTFSFSLNTAVPQSVDRTNEYRWSSQERFSQLSAKQFLGEGDETITLPGALYPGYRGKTTTLNDIRTLAESGEPQTLMDGVGTIYGRFVILSVKETRSNLAAFGVPRKIEFEITLRKFDGTSVSQLRQYLISQASTLLS